MNTQSSLISRLTGALVMLALGALLPNTVQAGGLYLFDRGARGLSRAGAFVAGVDDPSALWYNPAGLTASKNQVLTDATMSFLVNSSFTRVTVGPDGQEYRSPTVKPKPMYLPIPTLAFSHKFGLKDWTFGAGVLAPNVVILNYPQSVKGMDGKTNIPSPTRYSLYGLKGSILANLVAGVAWEPVRGLSIGADVHVILGQFRVRQALSACDRVVCAFPEESDFDATADVKLPTVAFSGVFGLTYDAKILRLGASAMLPYSLKGKANLDINLPSSPLFSGATLAGSKKADLSVNFPLIMRFGGELIPIKAIHMEGAFVLEKWSVQKDIRLTPENLQIRNVTGIGDYDVGPVTVQRKMRDTWSLRGGMEIKVPRRWSPWGTTWILRGGIAYEKSAFSSSSMTPLTLDADKFVLSGGFGVNLVKRLRFDTVLAYMFMADPKVRDSDIRQPQAIRPIKEEYGQPLGNGDYKMDALVLGGGFALDLN